MKKTAIFSLICFCLGSALFAQIGKVGINTTTPSAMLHVKDSSVLFTGIHPLPGVPGNPPATGAGTRMMWYPNKAAFRAGNINGTQWNKDSIGLYSVAFGRDTKAKGNTSFAMGLSTNANGNYSTALGFSTNANGNHSTAMGYYTSANGYISTVMGNNTSAGGDYSTAMGYYTSATGISSTAIGSYTSASGISSTAMGSSTSATGIYSTAMGFFTSATGDYSTAMGRGTIASAGQATAMGYNTSATGIYSTAMGYNTSATGAYSTALGQNTLAKSYNTVTIGNYNDTTNMTNPLTWVDTDPLFVVGNGTTNSSRKNAFTVLKNGMTGINTHDPKAMLHVIRNGSSGGTFHTNSAVVVESNTTSSYIQFSQANNRECGLLSGNALTEIRSGLVFKADSSIQFRAGGNITQLAVNANGFVGIGTATPAEKLHVVGDICYTGSIGACSDIRYKTNILPIRNALSSLQSIHGIYYHWDVEQFSDKAFTHDRQIGLSAQELELVYPEMVHTDREGYKSVDYSRLAPVLVEAVKEQQEIISSQQVRLAALEKELQDLKLLLVQSVSSN